MNSIVHVHFFKKYIVSDKMLETDKNEKFEHSDDDAKMTRLYSISPLKPLKDLIFHKFFFEGLHGKSIFYK